MLSSKTRYPVPSGGTLVRDENRISSFVLKSMGAALCGAAIPAVVFYFLF